MLTRTGEDGDREPFATGLVWPSKDAERRVLKPELVARANRFSKALSRGARDEQLRAIAQDRARPADAALTVARMFREAIGPSLQDLSYRERRYGRGGREVSEIGMNSEKGWSLEAVSMRGYADDVEDALGPDTLWADLMPADYNRLWKRGESRGVAESRVQCLNAVAGWAAENHRLPMQHKPTGVAKKAKKLTARAPRRDVSFTPVEYGRVLGALNAWKTHGLDIRAVRLMALAMEARPGQLLDMRGRDVMAVGGIPLFFPRSSDTKQGYPVRVKNRALHEWLLALGDNEPLFPAERDPRKAMRRERALELVKRIFEAADVRTDAGWNACRKATIDVAPEVLSWARKKGTLAMDDDAILDMLT